MRQIRVALVAVDLHADGPWPVRLVPDSSDAVRVILVGTNARPGVSVQGPLTQVKALLARGVVAGVAGRDALDSRADFEVRVRASLLDQDVVAKEPEGPLLPEIGRSELQAGLRAIPKERFAFGEAARNPDVVEGPSCVQGRTGPGGARRSQGSAGALALGR